MLGFLRDLQRRQGLAVVVVHHAKKGANRLRAGQALRGSSKFHAWGDSNLFLRRHGELLSLSVEHRAAPSSGPIPLTLTSDGDALALAVTDPTDPADHTSMSLDDCITGALAAAAAPLAVAQLRPLCRVRNATLYRRLAALCSQGILVKSTNGYRLASPSSATASRSL